MNHKMAFDDESNVIYGLDYQARSMCSTAADDEDKVKFLVGTQTLKFQNQICLLELDEDSNQVTKFSYPHNDGEIWHLNSCPVSSSLSSQSSGGLVSSCFSSVNGCRLRPGCAVWALPGNGQGSTNYNQQNNSSSSVLEKVASYEPTDEEKHISCFSWQPTGEKASGLSDIRLFLVDGNFDSKSMKVISEKRFETKGTLKVTSGKWNPHHNGNLFAVAMDSSVRTFDIRSMQCGFKIENAHIPLVRDIDFNPNRQYIVASCGDDCKIRFWDTRNCDRPLKTCAQHSHWVWSVRFNPVHDQLLLSCSSDARLILHSVASISSETIENLTGAADEQQVNDEFAGEYEKMEDGVIRQCEEHEESIYCSEWSVTDPWIFASLSYDGRVIFGKVPRKTKYQILQL